MQAGELLQTLFQFTPLHERQLPRFFIAAIPFPISIHASTWEAAETSHQIPEATIDFNSRLYMRGSRKSYSLALPPQLFQFTPLHERQHCPGSRSGLGACISIHASTWEAAGAEDHNGEQHTISIHASTWEAAGESLPVNDQEIFQFTPLHERQPLCSVPMYKRFLFQFTPLHERQRWQDAF